MKYHIISHEVFWGVSEKPVDDKTVFLCDIV